MNGGSAEIADRGDGGGVFSPKSPFEYRQRTQIELARFLIRAAIHISSGCVVPDFGESQVIGRGVWRGNQRRNENDPHESKLGGNHRWHPLVVSFGRSRENRHGNRLSAEQTR